MNTENIIAEAHIDINADADNVWDALVDPEKIKIAFLNIIVNATEAMKPDGNKILKLTTRESHNKCVIEISDNGIGLDASSADKLFEPFFTTKPKGNGLGLTNTQNIILNHSGTINVESKTGYGTTFTIKFNIQKPLYAAPRITLNKTATIAITNNK